MGSRYLTDLADVIRAAGLAVREYSGWQTRARGSGGYDSGRPTHVMVHHTASPPSWSGQRDADYCTVQDSDAPLANLCLDRDGVVWVLAAGATNTNGKGRDTWGGGVPDNSMNSYAIGIEANGGYGSSWPPAQCDAYVALVDALCRTYGIPNNNVRGHVEWAPDRKIDPAGVSPWSTSTATWDMSGFRRSCSGARPLPPDTGGGVGPPPLTEEDTMLRAAKNADTGNTFVLGDGKTAQTMDALDSTERALRVAGGVIDVKTQTIVYAWNNVGAIPGPDVKKYVGSY